MKIHNYMQRKKPLTAKTLTKHFDVESRGEIRTVKNYLKSRPRTRP